MDAEVGLICLIQRRKDEIMNNDMPNWRRFVEEITGRPYESPNREPPKKTKTTMDRRGGSEPRAKEIYTEKV